MRWVGEAGVVRVLGVLAQWVLVAGGWEVGVYAWVEMGVWACRMVVGLWAVAVVAVVWVVGQRVRWVGDTGVGV